MQVKTVTFKQGKFSKQKENERERERERERMRAGKSNQKFILQHMKSILCK
jgi:hypothetical protein